MTERLPGKYKETLHSKPWFHGGHVPAKRYSYSHSGLTPSDYPIKTRSAVPGTRALELPPPRFTNVDEKKPSASFREFKEYSFVRDNEVLLTIEHCDRCEMHQDTTHHDPVRYLSLAQQLKNCVLMRYPTLKVIIRPISSFVERGTANQRMGAFEIQICSKLEGRLVKDVLHSKLHSRKWPKIGEILGKISAFVPVCKIFVTLFSQDSPAAELKGLKILMRPKKLPLGSAQDLRVATPKHLQRPVSAVSHKSVLSMRKKSQGNTVLTVYERLTDRDGTCLFSEVPIDNYEIEVLETKNFKREAKDFNALEELEQKAVYNVYVEIKSRNICSVNVAVRDRNSKMEVQNAQLRLSKPTGELYFLPEVRKGTFEISVPRGEYSLSVQAPGYSERVKQLDCLSSDVVLTECLASKEQRAVAVYFTDIRTGSSALNALLNLSVNNASYHMEGVTSGAGFMYNIEQTGVYNLRSKKNMHIDVHMDFAVPHTNNLTVHVPAIVTGEPDVFYVVFAWPQGTDDIEIGAFTSDIVVNYSNSHARGIKLLDLMKTHGMSTLEIRKPEDKYIRVFGNLLSSEINTEKHDRAPLLNSGACVTVFYGNKQIARVLPAFGAGTYWDIGVLRTKHHDFIETNVFLHKKLEDHTEYMKDYKALLKFVRNPSPISTLFSFESGETTKTPLGNDKFLSPRILKGILEKLCSRDASEYITKGLLTPFGVSLNCLKRRFEYQREYLSTRPPKLQSAAAYARLLGMDPVEDAKYQYLAEEGLFAPLPDDWEIAKDLSGGILYRNSQTGEIATEHPNDAIYREKFLSEKQKELDTIKAEEAKVEVSSSSEEEGPVLQENTAELVESSSSEEQNGEKYIELDEVVETVNRESTEIVTITRETVKFI